MVGERTVVFDAETSVRPAVRRERRLTHPCQRQICCTSQQSQRLFVSISFYLTYNQVDRLYIRSYVANRVLYIGSINSSYPFPALPKNDHIYAFNHFCIVISDNEKCLTPLGSSIHKNKVICIDYIPQALCGGRDTGGHRDTWNLSCHLYSFTMVPKTIRLDLRHPESQVATGDSRLVMARTEEGFQL
jgi:hypothetical protein